MGKTIIDIRYCASEEPNEAGRSLPSDCSRFFNFPEALHSWGDRIAHKLGAAGLSLGDFDHLYINYTNTIPEGTIKLSERIPEKWLRFVDFGVSFDELKMLDDSEMENFVIDSTFKSLFLICEKNDDKSALIKSVARDVEIYGTELEIPVKTKETKSYSISVTYKVRPGGSASYGLVKYVNHKTGISFTKKLVELKDSSDIFPLVGSISVKDGKIIISPKPSFKAGLYTNDYATPLIVDINGAKSA